MTYLLTQVLRWLMLLPGARGALRHILLRSERNTLESLLLDHGAHELHKLLAKNNFSALLEIVRSGPTDLFPALARVDQDHLLTTLLFSNDANVLRELCGARERWELLPLFEEEKHRILVGMKNDDLLTTLQRRLPTLDMATALLRHPELCESLESSSQWQARMALAEAWNTIAPLLPEPTAETVDSLRQALATIEHTGQIRNQLLDVITDGDQITLAHGSLQFPDRHSLWTLIHEILLYEDYFFTCDDGAPRIIDGGTHMGMALYYFKSRFPRATVIGFEPVPALRDIALQNIAQNKYLDVHVLPYALAPTRQTTSFYVSESWSMAGSLHDRRKDMGDVVQPISVACVPLSDYLDEPVHFLKLDIEGPECEVLAEAVDKLPQVQYLFCEYHQGGGLGSERLGHLLAVLETAGFDIQVAKSHNFQAASQRRPLTHFDGAASMLIWGRNRHWNP